jgi:hypothetical protein
LLNIFRVTPPIIKSSKTVIAASGFTYVLVAARCPSSGRQPQTCVKLHLQFLNSWWWAVCHLKHVRQLRYIGIINSTTRLHLVDSFYEIKKYVTYRIKQMYTQNITISEMIKNQKNMKFFMVTKHSEQYTTFRKQTASVFRWSHWSWNTTRQKCNLLPLSKTYILQCWVWSSCRLRTQAVSLLWLGPKERFMVLISVH